MKRIFAEPLVHFVVLGAVVFAAYTQVSTFTGDEPDKIVVTQGQVASMALGFHSSWQRPPTDDELELLIRDRVQEEVYYREALALGLDREDTIIRRRLRQKMEFISEDVAAQLEPTDAQLHIYLKEHPDAFQVEPRFTFTQLFLNPERHGEHLARDTAQLLARVKQSAADGEVSPLGDSLMLEHKLEGLPISEVAKLFGKAFATTLGELPPGQWHGPVESGYGVHLVFVTERSEGRIPALEDVRDAIRREWVEARRVEADEKFYESLLQRYVVTIERP